MIEDHPYSAELLTRTVSVDIDTPITNLTYYVSALSLGFNISQSSAVNIYVCGSETIEVMFEPGVASTFNFTNNGTSPGYGDSNFIFYVH